MKELHKFWDGAHELESLPLDYESWSACQKQDFLWKHRILNSKYDTLPPLEKIDVIGLFFTILSIKMDRLSDETPRKWKKAIHAHGSVAKIKFVPAPNTPFTGLFKGASWGILRLSVTGDPADRGFAPGLALKLFVDGKPSENFSALVSLTGQGKNYNFFANEFSNIVPEEKSLGPKLINLIFRRTSKFPRKLYLQGFGEIDQQGNKESHPHYPYRIFLTPNLNFKFAERSPHDFRQDLAIIPSGTLLFSVYAVNPAQIGDDAADNAADAIEKPEYRQKAEPIGHIETTSEFVTSFYGDSLLFFRHQRFANK
ncbi:MULTISPECIES: hypothetical protein [unclassified Coleofasciculus]|uniref:hypothetical protein n=1 Tax=unclassified Coleofasciculus TaxID=2692782 RepID=UPI00187EFFEC|nr:MULTISPECIES: hypothetical protein [unclassified Coleofasciculus]MBE9128542.1 hypothetical protein [Coleofasciculus sp. LEGE 07081]MBE9151711.1 hypothetical protein [Coleofasciculus sp. LEGE 07092]